MSRIIIALILIALGAVGVSACECPGEPHGKKFREAKAIFVGRLLVIGAEEIRKEDSMPLHSLTFDVEKGWKGVKEGGRVIVFTGSTNLCSAFEFREGGRYLLYVRRVSEVLYVTSGCASSMEADTDVAQESMKDLSSFWFRLKSRVWRF